jgi:hypothetical protein
MIKKTPILLVCIQCCALAQTEPSASSQPAPENPALAAPQTSPGNADRSSDSVVDEIERLLREKENAEAAAAAQMEPSKPRTHRYTNQPISRVLRILAEQANINSMFPL